MSDTNLHFIPYYINELLKSNESLSGCNIIKAIDMKINNKDNAINQITMRGPGDIVGFNKNVIARLEPIDGRSDFEPNYFPFVEFIDPDFPWRYSLNTSVQINNSRPNPWISLIVLSNKEMGDNKIAELKNIGMGKELLYVDKKYLPDATTLWANAHVQIVETGSNNFGGLSSAKAYIEKYPSLCCSRLFCLRQLEPSTAYHAFIVPNYNVSLGAYESGKSQKDTQSYIAWGSNDVSFVNLPVYYKWSFFTSEAGDFEELARRLKPTEHSIAGTKPIDVGDKKYFMLEGAVVSPGFFEKRDKFVTIKPENLVKQLNETLNCKSLLKNNANMSFKEDSEDPLVSIPVYGRYFLKKSKVIKLPEENKWEGDFRWIDELNLDLRNRVIASLGTGVVQKNQDEYMKESWQQVGEIRKANEKLRLVKSCLVINNKIEKNYIRTLSDDSFIRITKPFHSQIIVELKEDTSVKEGVKRVEVSLSKAISDSGLPEGIISPVFSKISKRITKIQDCKILKNWDTAQKLSSVTEFDEINLKKLETAKKSVEKGDEKSIYIKKEMPKKEIEISHRQKLDNFKKEFGLELPNEVSEKTYAQTPKKEIVIVKPLKIDDFKNKIETKNVLWNKISNVISFSDSQNTLNENFDVILKCPEINKPMYKALCDISKEYIAPGVDKVENNSVSLMLENRRFIESFMCGLNHEMNNELVWREFPTDRRGTVFSYFWQPTQGEKSKKDINKIHLWKKLLGQNPGLPADKNNEPNLVLVIKGDIIRRYPSSVFYALKLKNYKKDKKILKYWSDFIKEKIKIQTQIVITAPSFRANIGNDILLVGFDLKQSDLKSSVKSTTSSVTLPGQQLSNQVMISTDSGFEYYFVLQENFSLPRFGLDVRTINTRNKRVETDLLENTNISLQSVNSDPKWSDVAVENVNKYILINDNKSKNILKYLRNKNVIYDSSTIAYKTIQKPIRVAFHQSEMLTVKG